MIDIKEIDEEIKKLESKDYTTYDVCEKFAILYTVKNNFKPSSAQKSMPVDSMGMDISKAAMRGV